MPFFVLFIDFIIDIDWLVSQCMKAADANQKQFSLIHDSLFDEDSKDLKLKLWLFYSRIDSTSVHFTK